MATTTLTAQFVTVQGNAFGKVELWISEPLAVGQYQTAPPFEATYELDPVSGTISLPDLPQRAVGESWYFVLMVYPVTYDCSKQGAVQFRFYIPEGTPATMELEQAVREYSAW